jgi:hypothetical protein
MELLFEKDKMKILLWIKIIYVMLDNILLGGMENEFC